MLVATATSPPKGDWTRAKCLGDFDFGAPQFAWVASLALLGGGKLARTRRRKEKFSSLDPAWLLGHEAKFQFSLLVTASMPACCLLCATCSHCPLCTLTLFLCNMFPWMARTTLTKGVYIVALLLAACLRYANKAGGQV